VQRHNTDRNAYDWYKFSTKQYRELNMDRSIIFTGFVYNSTVYTTSFHLNSPNQNYTETATTKYNLGSAEKLQMLSLNSSEVNCWITEGTGSVEVSICDPLSTVTLLDG